MKRILIAAIAAMTLATPATAQPPITPDELGSVTTMVLDEATGGCWTNMREAETYLADKMKYLGYDVVREYSGATAIIYILSKRSGKSCFGNIRIEISVTTKYNNALARIVLVDTITIFTGHANANLAVFDTIDAIIDELSNH